MFWKSFFHELISEYSEKSVCEEFFHLECKINPKLFSFVIFKKISKLSRISGGGSLRYPC